jgi:chaperonin GroEL
MQGIEALYEVAQDMQQREGDLTKTAVIMAGSMMAGGERLTASGIPIRPLLAGMQQASDAAATYLLGLATPVNPITMRQVALSACSNPRIAEAIASAVEKVGSDGVVDVMEAGEEEVQLEFQEGFQFDQGYLSPRFINNPETAECVLENVRVLVFEPRIASMAQLLPILEEIARSGESLLIISSDVEGEALSTLTVNVEKGTLRCVAVRSPGFGDRRRSILEDIAVVTGSRAFLQEDGIPLSSVRLSHLGKALRATVSLGSTSIVGAGGNPQSIATRVDSLRAQAASSPNSFDQAKLRERLARLVSGSATVRIGGHTESERSERIYGAHAALNACSTSMERGVVAGGGAALLRARLFARRIVFKDLYEGEGIQLVLNALMEPINVIMQNAKVRDPAEKLGTIVEAEVDTLTFDSESGRVADCRETGVMDSARSLSMAVTLACSHAKTHLRTGAWTQPSSGS